MVEFLPNVENAYVVRNDYTNFDIPEDKKTTVAQQIEISFGSADKTKTRTEQYGENGEHSKTTYYDVDGSELGSVFLVHDENANNGVRTSIHTLTADYHDWDGNGTIDDMAMDKVYIKKSRQEEACERVESFLKANNLSVKDLNNGQVMSKYINDRRDCGDDFVYSLDDIMIYRDVQHQKEQEHLKQLFKDAVTPMSEKIFNPKFINPNIDNQNDE